MNTLELSPQKFQQAFRTDQQCAEYIFKMKFPDGFVCKRCGHNKSRFFNRYGGAYQCLKCKYQETVKANTLFHKSKIPLRKWFKGIFEFTVSKGGISASELQRRLGFGCYETAWQMLHKLRIAMQQRDQQYILEGVIEVDNSYHGNRDKYKSRKFVVGIESKKSKKGKTYSRFAKAKEIKVKPKDEIYTFAKQSIKPKSEVKTDSSQDNKEGFKSVDIIHNMKVMNGFRGRLQEHLPLQFRINNNIKTKIAGTYHGVSSKYINRYISEYLYRFNRRYWPDQIQTRLITACLASGPVTYLEVTR